ncbi:HU family DNA-binding protein [Paracoccus marcusii]|jgi:integration host factor subunit beta|uniref:HU family DNA-binding protein n=1 Tax=Paracoccus marcusii TaxID=59779 RepID=UPI001C3D2336
MGGIITNLSGRTSLTPSIISNFPKSFSSPIASIAPDIILDEIAETLSQGQRMELRGFGSFSSKVRIARLGRNPRTGEAVKVPPKRHMHFRASRQLLERLNRPTTPG